MRSDVIPGNVWVELDQVEIESEPPVLKVSVQAGHVFSDRKSELRLNLIVSSWNSIVGTASIYLFLPQGFNRVQQNAFIVLSNDIIRTIETLRQKNKSDDVVFNIRGSGLYIAYPASQYQMVFLDAKSFDIATTFSVSISQWKNVLGLVEHRIILLDSELLNKLEEIRRKWGVWRIEDVIYKLMEIYEGKGAEITHHFIATLIESKTIRDKIDELSKLPSWREIKVVSLYIDNTGAEYLIKMIKNGSKIKVITRKPDKKAHLDALTALNQHGAEIRVHNMAHARMIIFDDLAAIISSADIDSEGLNNQRQAGIYTTDKTVIRDASVFFDKLWSEAETFHY